MSVDSVLEETSPPEVVERSIVEPSMVNGLTDLLLDSFPTQRSAHRQMGLRAQFPIAGLDGKAGDTGMLWPFLKGDGFEEYREPNGMMSALHGERFSYSVTAGRGVMEIQIPLVDSLLEMQDRLYEAVARLIPAAERWKKHVLAYGGLPATSATPDCLTHKFHYFSLLRAIQEPYLVRGLQATNRFWLNSDRQSILDEMNWFHLLSPLVAMWSSNTPIFAGEDGYYPSSRWQHQSNLDVGDGRWQIVHTPYSGMDEWVFHTLHQPHLLLRDDEGWLNPGEGLFGVHCHDKLPIECWDAYRDHLETMWTMTHPVLNTEASLPSNVQGVSGLQVAETEQGSIEDTMAMAALLLGCAEEAEPLMKWLEDLVPDPPEKREWGLRPEDILQRNLDYHKDVWAAFFRHWNRFSKQGVMHPEPFFGCVDGIFSFARRGLEARGLGEEVLLDPLEHRIRRQMDWSSEIRRQWLLHGNEGLIRAVKLSLRPECETS